MRDLQDKNEDRSLAKHILKMRTTGSFPDAPPMTPDFLKKHILLAKKIKQPFMPEAVWEIITQEYEKLRRKNEPGEIPFTPRVVDTLDRLTKARARILLHEEISIDDARAAIDFYERTLHSFEDPYTKKVDAGIVFGKPVSEKGLREAAVDTFKRLSGESRQPVQDSAFLNEIVKIGKFTREQAEKVFQDLWKSGVIYEVKAHFFKKM